MLMASPSCALKSYNMSFVRSVGTAKTLKEVRVAKKAIRQSVSVSAAVEAPAPVVAAVSTTEQAEKLLDIVFVATEVSPWSKTGGFVFVVSLIGKTRTVQLHSGRARSLLDRIGFLLECVHVSDLI